MKNSPNSFAAAVAARQKKKTTTKTKKSVAFCHLNWFSVEAVVLLCNFPFSSGPKLTHNTCLAAQSAFETSKKVHARSRRIENAMNFICEKNNKKNKAKNKN